ncbi:J domain-containing protein [Streptomyces sp. TRM S81-3]|uniref:J domain-containing protein n=1 Tax=Streptomyces griseicoloratus TaxID=2752516 RepID=A0A926KYX5_9ACTN|nr:J domain-containing protein [Streptomyces griseicoloratus]MBD0419430.1 J domain-containing protein [Streptomyces griseicoloratus]
MIPADEPDFYAVLGVPADATRAEIVRAFRRQAFALHPDRGGDADDFRALHRAYETLADPVGRGAYDRRRRTASPPSPPSQPGAHRPPGEPQPAPADPFAWTPGAGPRTDTRSGHARDHGMYAVPFPAHDPGCSWRRADRFAWWVPADEPRPKRRRRRRR